MSLKQMAEDKENPAVSKLTGFYVDPRVVEFEDGFNLRVDTPAFRESIQELKVAYINGAEFPPIDVRDVGGRILVVEGHRRTLAARAAIAEGHPVRRMEAREFKGNDIDRVRHMLGTGAGTRPLSTLEKGIGYKRLMRLGWTKQEVCADRHVSITHVDQALMLANANVDVQKLVAYEQVSVGAALAALREHGEDAGDVLQAMVNEAPTEVASDGQERRKKVTQRQANASGKPKAAALPRALTERHISSVGALFSAMTDDFRARIVTATDDAMIPVSARYLKDLLEAHAEATKIRGDSTSSEEPAIDPRQASLLAAS